MGLNALSTWNLLQLLCGLGLLVAGAELLVRCAVGMAATLKVRPLLIGLTIILLFLGETTNFRSNSLAVAGFLAGVVSFLLALALAETLQLFLQ